MKKNIFIAVLAMCGLCICRSMDSIVYFNPTPDLNTKLLILMYIVCGIMLITSVVPILWNIGKEYKNEK